MKEIKKSPKVNFFEERNFGSRIITSAYPSFEYLYFKGRLH